MLRACIKNLNEVELNRLVNTSQVKDFEYEKDAEKLTELVKWAYNVPEEQAKPVVERFTTWRIGSWIDLFGQKQRLISHPIIYKGDEMIGRALGLEQETIGDNTLTVTSMFVKDDDQKVKHQLLSKIIKDGIKMDYKKLLVHTGEYTREHDEDFEDLGFKFESKLAWYDKSI